MDTSENLMPNNGHAVSQLEYSRVIGCLMYAMTCTRPDIAFAVGKLSRYTGNPSTQHWQAIQRVLKYWKKKNLFITSASLLRATCDFGSLMKVLKNVLNYPKHRLMKWNAQLYLLQVIEESLP